MHILCIFVHISSHFRGQDDSWEDIAELANVLAWDAVGAQIEPYLVQHAEWQRPCGVALGCRSLNSRGIKMLRRTAVFYPQRCLSPDTFVKIKKAPCQQ
jgi:hypothetical protein